ncbi:MAG TPA: AraC family transcriptional regulator [Saprospiraceae bacterium]|nr:AraC family transcriptional regulator [Saprospiraceae bacterium]
MKLHVRFDMVTVCKIVLHEQLEKLGIPFEMNTLGEIEFQDSLSTAQQEEINIALRKYGIELLDDQKVIFVQKIKDTIIELVNTDEKLSSAKFSDFLARKLNYSYGHISKLFSDVTYTSIENFIILQKIERAKQLILSENLTLTEVAWKLNYSSVQHLSNQFKKTTGITPTAFQRIIKMRRLQSGQSS